MHTDTDTRPPLVTCISPSPNLEALVRDAVALSGLLSMRPVFIYAGADTGPTRDRLEEALRGAGIEPSEGTLEIRQGAPIRVVRRLVDQLGAPLVLAGALERESLVREVVGSVARRLGKELPCSVMLSTAPKLHERAWSRMVVSVRTGEDGEAMATFAAELCRRAGVKRVDFIWEYDSFREAMGTVAAVDQLDTSPYRREAEARQRAELANFLERIDLHGLHVRTAALAGREGVETCRYAERVGAELIVAVAPARRLTQLDRFFRHRTVALLDELPCGVLLYRPGLVLEEREPGERAPDETGSEGQWSD